MESFAQRVADFERGLILEALSATGWNVKHAAQRLTMPRTTLIDRIAALGIDSRPADPLPIDYVVTTTNGGASRVLVDSHNRHFLRDDQGRLERCGVAELEVWLQSGVLKMTVREAHQGRRLAAA